MQPAGALKSGARRTVLLTTGGRALGTVPHSVPIQEEGKTRQTLRQGGREERREALCSLPTPTARWRLHSAAAASRSGGGVRNADDDDDARARPPEAAVSHAHAQSFDRLVLWSLHPLCSGQGIHES